MTIYAITHCYTDLNKGDAAIIQSTIALLRSCDSNAKINLYSTFGPKDNRFLKEHRYIKALADEIYPAILSTPERLKLLPYEISRVISFLINFIQSLLLLISINPIWIDILTRDKQSEGVKQLAKADIIISKGGSYLTSQNRTFRQAISLWTMLFPFIFALRYRRKCIIFSQSLGPINGKFNQFLFTQILKRIDKIYVRETLCIKEYAIVKRLNLLNEMQLVPDTAFYYKIPSNKWRGSMAYTRVYKTFDQKRLKVGITIVDHAFKYIKNPKIKHTLKEQYINSIISMISYLRKHYDAQIHIFPQVTVDNSFEGHNDKHLSRKIAKHFFFIKDGKNVNFHEYNLSPVELRELYRNMDIFVGTRLHSVIFALSTGCPSINISYHGTKSKGIFSHLTSIKGNILSIDNISAEELITKVKSLIKHRFVLRSKILKEVNLLSKELLNVMACIVDLAKKN